VVEPRARGEKPWLVTCDDEDEQAEFVVEKILEHREGGLLLREQAVLFRASHHSILLEAELARRNIPFVKYGGLKFIEAAQGPVGFLAPGREPGRPGGRYARASPVARHRAGKGARAVGPASCRPAELRRLG
jgi:superfamily I DNA/RNA helicase